MNSNTLYTIHCTMSMYLSNAKVFFNVVSLKLMVFY